ILRGSRAIARRKTRVNALMARSHLRMTVVENASATGSPLTRCTPRVPPIAATPTALRLSFALGRGRRRGLVVVTLAAAVEQQRHQAAPDHQPENQSSDEHSQRPWRNVDIAAVGGPSQVCAIQERHEKCEQHSGDQPWADLAFETEIHRRLIASRMNVVTIAPATG